MSCCKKEKKCCDRVTINQIVNLPELLFDCETWQLLFGSQVIDLSCLSVGTVLPLDFDCVNYILTVGTQTVDLSCITSGLITSPWQVGTGLHSVNVIWDNTNISSWDYSLAWGNSNQALAEASTIAWWFTNIINASGRYATISWGWQNLVGTGVATEWAVIWWGAFSQINLWIYHTIWWWYDNYIDSEIGYSTISWWQNNQVLAPIGTIWWWQSNTILPFGLYSTIGWGRFNIIENITGWFIGWWELNYLWLWWRQQVSYQVVVWWLSNAITSDYSFSAIVWGEENLVDDAYGFIGNWKTNSIFAWGTFGTISWGEANIIWWDYSSISNGKENTALAEYGFIGTWFQNFIDNAAGNATIVNWQENYIWLSSMYSMILHWRNNFIGNAAEYNTIYGWNSNTIGNNAQDNSVIWFRNSININKLNNYLMGTDLRWASDYSITIGRGLPWNELTNNDDFSVYIGMNSDLPTVLISQAAWAWTYGQFGLAYPNVWALNSTFNNNGSKSETRIRTINVWGSLLPDDYILRVDNPAVVTINLPPIASGGIWIGKTYEIIKISPTANWPVNVEPAPWETISWAITFVLSAAYRAIKVRAHTATAREIVWIF